jgi:hypothetical protein
VTKRASVGGRGTASATVTHLSKNTIIQILREFSLSTGVRVTDETGA